MVILYDMERFKQILITIIFIAFFIFVMTLPGCKVIERVEYVTKTDTVVLVDHKIDSAYVKDSVYVYKNSDTVYISKWRERIKYIEKKDSIYISSTDTLYVDKVNYKEVEKKRPVRNVFAFIGLLSVVVFVGYLLYRFKK